MTIKTESDENVTVVKLEKVGDDIYTLTFKGVPDKVKFEFGENGSLTGKFKN